MGPCRAGGAHHWLVDSLPVRGVYHAVCRKCEEQRTFPAVVEITEEEGLMPQKKKGKITGRMFEHPELMEQRSREYEEKKTDFIDLYLRLGSYYQAARAAGIPVTSMRQLVERWEKDGSIQARRDELAEKQSPASPEEITGDIIGLSRETDGLIMAVSIAPALMERIHLGRVKIEYFSGNE